MVVGLTHRNSGSRNADRRDGHHSLAVSLHGENGGVARVNERLQCLIVREVSSEPRPAARPSSPSCRAPRVSAIDQIARARAERSSGLSAD